MRGVIGHEFIENSHVSGRDVALELVPGEDNRYWCSQIDLSRIFDGIEEPLLERCYAVDVVARTARLLPKAQHWQYKGGPSEFLGICDMSGFQVDEFGVRLPLAADHKTGRQLDKPDELSQLLLLASALYLINDKPSGVIVRINYIEPDGNVRVESRVVPAKKIEEFIDRLAHLLSKIIVAHDAVMAGRAPQVNVGDHCKFAKCYASCPAKVELLKKSLPDVAAYVEELEMLTPKAVGWAWSKVKEIRDWVDRLDAVVDEAAKMADAPLPLPNGKFLKFVEQRGRKSLNQGRLIKLAKDSGVSDEEIAACYTANSFKAPRQVNNP